MGNNGTVCMVYGLPTMAQLKIKKQPLCDLYTEIVDTEALFRYRMARHYKLLRLHAPKGITDVDARMLWQCLYRLNRLKAKAQLN